MRDGKASRAVLLVALGASLVLAAAGCGGSDQSAQLKDVAWQWSAIRQGEGVAGLSPILDPENYLLRLDDDGTFVGRADCKSVAGSYELSGSELTLELRPTAKRTCGKDSRADEYVALLRRVANYEIYEKGSLSLGLEKDTGHMFFYSGTASSSP